MRNSILSYLLLPLFTGLSFSLSAAPGPQSGDNTGPAVVQEQMVFSQDHKLNLNDADAASLQSNLSGIGRTKAEAIVAYRNANGPFDSVDELLEIKGIGNALLERNRDKLIVE